jgi:hypothetical protein
MGVYSNNSDARRQPYIPCFGKKIGKIQQAAVQANHNGRRHFGAHFVTLARFVEHWGPILRRRALAPRMRKSQQNRCVFSKERRRRHESNWRLVRQLRLQGLSHQGVNKKNPLKAGCSSRFAAYRGGRHFPATMFLGRDGSPRRHLQVPADRHDKKRGTIVSSR